MSAGFLGSRNLIIVAALVIGAAVVVSLLSNNGNKANVATTVTETPSPGDERSAGGGTSTQTEAATIEQTRQVAGNTGTVKVPANSPDIMFVDWNFAPQTPVQGKPVMIVASIKNNGSKPAATFNVAWYASAERSVPAHVWAVPALNPGSRYKLEYEYAGFTSGHTELQTMLVIDPEGVVDDKDRTNNEWVRTITVAKQ